MTRGRVGLVVGASCRESEFDFGDGYSFVCGWLTGSVSWPRLIRDDMDKNQDGTDSVERLETGIPSARSPKCFVSRWAAT